MEQGVSVQKIIPNQSGSVLLKKALTKGEYDGIPLHIRNKIESALGEHIDDYLTAKALFESTQAANDAKVAELNDSLEKAIQERDVLRIKVEGLVIQCEEATSRLNNALSELNLMRSNVQRCEKEVEVLKKQRDEAVDERQIAVNLVERKSIDIDRLTSDVNVLNEQLKQAVAAKCEAMAASDDVATKQVELELKERRMESERTLLTQQNVDLRIDLARIAEEMTQQRRENSAEIQSLVTKLSIKDDELSIANEQKKQLTQANEELTSRIEKLTENLKEQMDAETKIVEKYQNEVKAQAKLVDLHKNMLEVCEGKISELSGAVRDLQRLLQEASTQYGELETKLAQKEEEHNIALAEKQKGIDALKEELKSANELLSQTRYESTEEAISRISPLAASTSKLLKSGLTLTQLYSQYAQVSEELLNQKQENTRLSDYVNRVLQEIEDKAPVLQKQREDYDYAINMVDSLKMKVDDLEKEQIGLRKQAKDAECNVQFLTRENKRFKTSVSDLSRQVCYLLKELEASRGNFFPVHDPSKLDADLKTSSEVIEKHLVTFKDIEELQLNNQKLMAALRELSDEKNAEESRRECKEVTDLKSEIKQLNSRISDLEEREQVLLKQIDIIKGQRDIYQRLLKQHTRPGSMTLGSEESSILEDTECDEVPQKLLPSPVKPKQSAEPTLDDGSKLALEELKHSYDTYREERAKNEKMLNESINRLQSENSKLASDRAQLAAQAEYLTEKCKTLISRNKSQTTQIQALEQKSSTYMNSNNRLEESQKQLRQEAMNAITKLSVAEATVANLKQENQLLKDAENRLLKERNTERKMKLGQEMLMANLEALKAKFECTDAEGRMRLETRLDEANTERAALRRRLQEEQDRLGKKIELLEEQAKTAKERLEEERKAKEKLTEELEKARETAKQAEAQMEEASNRLGSAITSSQPVIERDNRIKELEGKVRDYETDLKNMTEKLNQMKKNCEGLKDVCEVTEKQLIEVTEKYESLKKESDSVITEMKKNENELKNSITQLEIRVSTSRAAEAEVAAQREGELASLRSKVVALGDELRAEKEKCSSLEVELKDSSVNLRKETDKFTAELEAKNLAQQECAKLNERLKEILAQLEEKENSVARAAELQKIENSTLEAKVAEANKRAEESATKLAELTATNDMLHDQIGQLTERLAVKMSSDHQPQEGDVDPSNDSKTLVEVLQYVRKEKIAALALVESLKTEKLRLEAEVEVMKIQLAETKKALEDERNKSDTPSIAAKKHAELLQQVEVVSQLTESNKNLTEEVNRLTTKIAEVEADAKKVDEEVVSPAKLRASELANRLDTLQAENQSLKQETTRWQARTEELIEKCSKTNPEDLKRLTMEKENLTKQLTAEREQAKAMKTRFEQQIENGQKEKILLRTELKAMEGNLNAIKAQLETVKHEYREKTEKLSQSENNSSLLTTQIEEIKAKEIQIRQIAKKYKNQFLELTKVVQEEKKAKEAAAGASTSTASEADKEENKLLEEKMKQLNEQMLSLRSELETVRKDNENLQNSSLEKEDRAKNLLKNARNRVVQLTEEKNSLAKELNEMRSRPKGDAESRICALESRITRLEKEKADEQSEKERLGSEVETLTQKLSLLQRQLDKHQGSKPSTSCAEKGTNEPPTANIKPMAGTSSSTSKQHQSATVTPWRETTPFASIRPMSQPTRTTVVVLPTSQTTSTSNQPVMVAPQQSVHTSTSIEAASPSSSHMDYMPVTSSHAGSAGQAVARPLMVDLTEEEGGPQPQQQNVAMVLPQPQPARPPPEQQVQSEANENTAVVSASGQEPSEQSVSASQPPVVPVYYRQVEEGGGSVASSQSESNSGSSTSGAAIAGGSSSSGGQQASSSSNVTTSQGGTKRPHPPSSPGHDPDSKLPQQVKRSRVSGGTGDEEMLLHSDSLEVEYQVPTSSQRDQDDPLVISDEDEIPDQGAIEDGGEFEEETEEEARYGMENYNNEQELTSFDDAEGPDIDEGSNTDQDNNEVDIIVDVSEDSNEVPNQCESTGGSSGVGTEATSSGAVLGQQGYQPRRSGPTPANLPLLTRHHSLLMSYEESGDDSIVPSTPTLYVPRRVDGFSEAVSSPHVPSPRFTFGNDPQAVPSQQRQTIGGGVAQVASEGMDDTRMDLSQLDEGRRVPTTPSHVSPQDGGSSSSSSSSGSGEIGQSIGSGEVDDMQGQPSEVNPQTQAKPDEMTTTSTDGVSSEGEKRVEVVEEEGREAEASGRGGGGGSGGGGGRATAKRSVRVTARRAPPQPIVWDQPNVSTSAVTPTTQTVTMIPIRGMMARGRGMASLPVRGEICPQPGPSQRSYRGGNRARRSARMPFHFQNQNRYS